MDLAPLLEPGIALVEEGPLALGEALRQLAGKAAGALHMDAQQLLSALQNRERLRPTALPGAVALPHAIMPGIPRSLVVPMVVHRGVVMDPSEAPSTVIIGLFGNSATPWIHIKLLARLARIAHDQTSLDAIRRSIDANDLLERMKVQDAIHA